MTTGIELLADKPMLTAGIVDIDLSFVFMLGLFLLFWFFMNQLITKPMMKSQAQRHESIEGAQEVAAAADLTAAETRKTYEHSLSEARQAAVVVRDEIRDAATSASRKAVAGVRQEASAELSRGQVELAAAATHARGDMSQSVDDLASALASKLIAGASQGAKA